MRRMIVLGLLVVAGAVTISAMQAPEQKPNVAEIEKVRDNLFLIKGGGGNTAAFVTATGVVLVDTKLANWGPAIMDKVRSVTDKPVTMIVNTHTHGDHTGSNDYFPASVEIVAHKNTKANMQRMKQFEGDNKKFLPDRTYKDRKTLLKGADRIDLYYFGPGHTNGDTIVVFPALGVAHTGDLFARAGTPLIDVANGGSGIAYPDTIRKAAAGIKGVETVIAGHTPAPTTWAAFAEFGEFNAAFLAATKEAMSAGKSVEDAVAGLKLPEKFKDYGMQGAKDNVTKIYAELQAK
jgi:cyclase